MSKVISEHFLCKEKRPWRLFISHFYPVRTLPTLSPVGMEKLHGVNVPISWSRSARSNGVYGRAPAG